MQDALSASAHFGFGGLHLGLQVYPVWADEELAEERPAHMGLPQFTIEWVHGAPDFWALSDQELAASCLRIAHGCEAGQRPLLREEAERLVLLWWDALYPLCRTREEGEQKAGERAALRKRTIQVLVRMSVSERERDSGAFERPDLIVLADEEIRQDEGWGK